MMITSKRISILFASYVSLVVIVFGVVVNAVFFVSWYRLVAQHPTPPLIVRASGDQAIMKSDMIHHDDQDNDKDDNKANKMQQPKRVNRIGRRPLMGLGEPVIITDVVFIQELQQYDTLLDLISYKDQIWHFRILPDRVILTLVDPLIDSQLMLIYITLGVAFSLAMMSYWVSMIVVRRGLKPLYLLVDHIHQTQDPEKYEHIVVGPDQDELQQVSTALTHAMDTIARQTRNLKQFVTHASHELKTPLMTISSSIDLMNKSGIINSQTSAIKQTTVSMKHLIDRLMITMRYDVIQTQQLLLDVLIRDVVDRISVSHGYNHVVDMSISEHLIKHSDPMVCESIITNLIENAYKYARGDVPIEIIANAKQFIIYNQVDPGQNIDLEMIWQPFYRADESRTDGTSHGLGLTIVKQMVERMGWKIVVAVKGGMIEFVLDWAE